MRDNAITAVRPFTDEELRTLMGLRCLQDVWVDRSMLYYLVSSCRTTANDKGELQILLLIMRSAHMLVRSVFHVRNHASIA
jgi:hypothetical protein